MKMKKLLYQRVIRVAKKYNVNNQVKNLEKHSKSIVNKELAEFEYSPVESREDILNKTKETLNELIQLQGEEDLINQEIEFTGRNALLKKRLVHLYCSGKYTNRQLAQIFCVTPGTIGAWLRQEDVKEAITQYQSEEDIIVTSMMKALRIRSIERAAELIEGDNEMVSAIMIRDLLDRTGHKPVERKEVAVNMTYEERIQKLVEGVDYAVDIEESDLSQTTEISTEGENNSDL